MFTEREQQAMTISELHEQIRRLSQRAQTAGEGLETRVDELERQLRSALQDCERLRKYVNTITFC